MQDSVLERLYGKSDILEGGNALNVVENPSFLSIIPAAKEKSPLPTNAVSNGLTPSVTSRPQTTKQIETRTSDGRRRITPIFIPLSHENKFVFCCYYYFNSFCLFTFALKLGTFR